MFNSPIIVIGPPRSGTTMTARVLQEWFGILMDGAPVTPPKNVHKYNWLEDSRLIEMNNLLRNGTIKLNAWTRRFKRFIRSMQKLNRPWGFKDPRIIPVFSYALTFFDMPIVVRCCRPRHLIIDSCVKKLEWPRESAENYIRYAEAKIDLALKNYQHYKIDFSKYMDEENLISIFENSNLLRMDYAA